MELAEYGHELITAGAALAGVALGAVAEWLRHKRRQDPHREAFHEREMAAAERAMAAVLDCYLEMVLLPAVLVQAGQTDELARRMAGRSIDDLDMVHPLFVESMFLPERVVSALENAFIAISGAQDELNRFMAGHTTADAFLTSAKAAARPIEAAQNEIRRQLGIEALSISFMEIVRAATPKSRVE